MVVELLKANPEFVVVLAVVMRAILAWQRSLTWPEYRLLHRIQMGLFPLLYRHAQVVSWINVKSGRDDAEYLTTEPGPLKNVVGKLRDAGGRLHLLASVKRRPRRHGDRYSAAHVVFLHDDDTQTEAFCFRNNDGSVDVYAHHEPAPSRPLAHLGGDEQSDGDVRDVVADALGL